MKRNRGYYRHHRERAMKRKYNIRKNQWSRESIEDYYSDPRNYGALDKGKVHCGCGMCVSKTKIYGYKRSEKRHIDSMKKEIRDYFKYDETD